MFIERHQVASIVRFRVRKDVSQSVWRKFYNDLILKIRSQNVLFLWRLVIIHQTASIVRFTKKIIHPVITLEIPLRILYELYKKFELDLKSAELRFESVGEREEEREREKEETRYFRAWKKKGKPGVESDLIGNGRCLPV